MATRLLDRIKNACERFCRIPLSGVTREQFAPGLRAGFVGNYVIYYRETRGAIEIVRVLHGSRDVGGAFQT